MTLAEYLPTYMLEHDLRPTYVKHLHHTVRCFTEFTGHKPLADISSNDINRWTEFLEVTPAGRVVKRQMAKRTIRNKISALMTLLRATIEDGIRPPLVGRVKRLRVRGEPVRAFSLEDVGRLLQAASEMPGYFERTGLSRATWWIAVIHTAWDTALRIVVGAARSREDLRPAFA